MVEYREANRALWNAWTRINVRSELYNVEAFAAGGGRDLDPIARAGPGDVRGKSLLHLQCHFGMDTIRWARHGATVTGVDFAEEAVTAARALAARCPRPSPAASTSSSPRTGCWAGCPIWSAGPR